MKQFNFPLCVAWIFYSLTDIICSGLVSSCRKPLKPRLHQGNMLPGNMLLVAVNNIVASLLPVCCWIQRDTIRP